MLVLQQILKFESSLSVHVNAVALGVAQCLKNKILLAYVYPYATTCGAYTFYWPVYPSATRKLRNRKTTFTLKLCFLNSLMRIGNRNRAV